MSAIHDFEFYATAREAHQIFEVATKELSWRYLPSRNFTSPEPSPAESLSQEFWGEMRNAQFFIIGEFTVEQLVFSKVERGTYEGTFTLNQHRSGPLIEVLLPIVTSQGDFLHLTRGLIAHSTKYWTRDFKSNYPAPDSLLKAYARLKAFLKSSMVFQKLDCGKKVWIAPEAATLLLAGKALVSAFGAMCSAKK